MSCAMCFQQKVRSIPVQEQAVKRPQRRKYSWVWDIPAKKLPKRAEELWPTRSSSKSEATTHPPKRKSCVLGHPIE